MLKNLLKKEKGFTLIEIVLVLAIAGLILVIVFLAVGGAQRSRRDGQRKSDASRILAAYESNASNNQGVYLADNTAIPATYFAGNDPNGVAYTEGSGAVVGTYDYQAGAHCVGNVSANLGAGNDRIVSVVIFQEAGGTFCVDNE